MKIDEFINELTKLGISITKKQLNQLELFSKLLIEWNQKINLTRIIEKDDIYLKHFYDSLTISKIADLNKVETLCDVGTGGGFPGIPLKILFPNIKITLIDSLQKRVNYLNDIIKQLSLENINAIHIRGEEYAKINSEKFDIVTARAVANLKELSSICLPLVKINGFFISMKANATEEIEVSKKSISDLGGQIEKIEVFKLPKENSIRTLIKIKKITESNKKIPKSKGKIKNVESI